MLALVLGGAKCVWDDVKRVKSFCSPNIVAAVNETGAAWPYPLDHWVSFHPDKLEQWVEERRKNGLPEAGHLWTGPVLKTHVGIAVTQHKVLGGSSGLLALMIMLARVQATHVIIAGMPMDPEMPHWHSNHGNKPWTEAEAHRAAWIEHHPLMGNRARSMSGWTADLLGRPDPSWLGEYFRANGKKF